MKAAKKQHMIQQTKELQEQMRNKVTGIHQSGKSYKTITKGSETPVDQSGENWEQW